MQIGSQAEACDLTGLSPVSADKKSNNICSLCELDGEVDLAGWYPPLCSAERDSATGEVAVDKTEPVQGSLFQTTQG